MAFQVCPYSNAHLSPRLVSVMPDPGKTRKPLTVRAEKFAIEKPLLPQAIDISGRNIPLMIGSNRILIEDRTEGANTTLIREVLSNFMPVADNITLCLRFTKFMLLKGTVYVAHIRGLGEKEEEEIFSCSLYINGNEMDFQNFSSNQEGCGGRVLAATYNLARALDVHAITYSVNGNNLPAKQFYLHMDFGYPCNPDLTEWRVDL